MGAVYKAKHQFLKSLHAIKIISPEVVREDETLLIRFRQEAILAASIHHPNVVTVTDFGVENKDTPFLVMEYIEGVSLDEVLRREVRLTPAKALEILEPIILGVGEAHSRGITHRDLKPLNVMLRNGRPPAQAVKVLDFGLAKIKSTESFASLVQAKTTSLLGSPQYMSPEQWANEDIDTRTDIYSLGILLFQMLTGEVPFKGDSIPTIMYQHFQGQPPSFESLGISGSHQIEAVIHKALAKKQSDRFATVEEFLAELKKAIRRPTNQATLKLIDETDVSALSPVMPAVNPKTKPIQKETDKDFDKSYNLPYLTLSQNETLSTYFNQTQALELEEKENLAQEFIHAQNRVEEARTKASEAERLAQEFNEAQKAAEDARHKVLEARQKLEEDVRRRMQEEMAEKFAVEREAREKAEQEARLLMEEAKARKEAEERANALAKTALEAQQRAEQERQKAEKEVQQRRLEESSRQKAEEAASQLAQEVVDAKKRYDQAKREAENEARFRIEAEIKRKKIEEEIHQIKEDETYKRKKAEQEARLLMEEAKARKEAEERANALAKTALEAQQRAEQERQKAEKEVQQRRLEESSRQKAEEAASQLAQEVVDAKKRYDQAKREAENEARFRIEAEIKRKKIEEEIQQIKEYETHKRKIVEEQAAQQIREQADRLEKQALEAQQKANEARLLVESEVQKREQAEAARIKAELEARRLAEEIIEAQTRLQEAQQMAKSESEKRALEEEARKKAEESARLTSLQNQQNIEKFNNSLEVQTLWSNPVKNSSPNLHEGTFDEFVDQPSERIFIKTTSSGNVGQTNQIPVPKRFKPLILISGLFAFLLIGTLGGYLIYRFSNISSTTAGNTPGNSKDLKNPLTADASRPSERVTKKMVQIAGGSFQMGRNDVSSLVREFGVQFPAHPASVENFYIDRTEVTNEEYAEFIEATGHKAPDNWQAGKPPSGQEKFPVTFVSNFDARDFADWLSKRDSVRCQLPTEEEWEFAARSGTQQNIYPWGNEWIPGRVNIDSGLPREVGTTGDETSVGGIKEMMGNVMEWTFTTFKYYPNFPPEDEDPNIKANIFIAVRGSSFAATKNQIENKHFLLTSRRGIPGDTKAPYLGFRLVCRP